MPATPENVFSVHPFARTGLHIVSVPYRACGQCVKRAFPATRRRRLSPPARPKHASCFRPNIRSDAFGFAVLPKEQKTRQQKLLSGTKSWTLRCHPALTRHRCRTHSSTANTVRLLTRALRPRLLVAFRLGPPGPILSGSVPAGITPPPTLSESVTRFLPVNGLLSCLNTITAFFCCQRIFCSSATFFIIEPFPALGAFFCIAKLPSVPVSGILHPRILVSPAAHMSVLPYENTPSLFIRSFQAPAALSASPSFNMPSRGARPRTFCTHRARITFKKIFGRHCRERRSRRVCDEFDAPTTSVTARSGSFFLIRQNKLQNRFTNLAR